MKIRIESASIQTREQTSRRTSKPFTVRTQEGWVQIGREVRRIQVGLDREQPAYVPGEYVLGDASFEVDQFGSLKLAAFGRLALEPVVRPAVAAAKVV